MEAAWAREATTTRHREEAGSTADRLFGNHKEAWRLFLYARTLLLALLASLGVRRPLRVRRGTRAACKWVLIYDVCMLEARYMIDKLGFLMSLCTKQWGIDWACRIIEFAPKAVVLFRLFLWLWRRIIESSMTQQEEIRTRKWMGVQGPGWKFFVLVQNWSRDISIYNLKNLKKKIC